MKKILFNLAVFLCGITAQIAANNSCQNYSNNCYQNCNDCCEWSLLDGRVTIGADWLYWKVQQDGILPGSIVIEDTFTEDNIVMPFTKTRRIHPDPKWKSGFRVYLGYELPCDCWDVRACYTYIPSRDKLVNFAAKENKFFESSFFGNVDFFASKWDLTLNNFDLDIGRTVCFGECLRIRPHVGFRATWFDQKFRALGAIQSTDEPADLTFLFDALHIKQKFQGYGVEAGLWAEYQFTCGLSLVGHFGGSILYSKFKICHRDASGFFIVDEIPTTTDILDEDFTVTFSNFERDSFFTATPSLDYFVGLQYSDTVCDMLYKVFLGWEQHVLFDTNRFLSTGNLSAQGLTLGFEVGF